jgi:2-dehydropantoate 2-reductase
MCDNCRRKRNSSGNRGSRRKILLVSKSSDGQLISTFQDILNKRQTEIETLNFAIVDIAKKLNKEELGRETKLLGELTRLKSYLSNKN